MLQQLFYRQERRGTFFSLFSKYFYFWITMNFPHLSSLLYAKSLQVSFIAHTDAFLILVLKILPICSVNTCKLQHYLLLSVYWTVSKKNNHHTTQDKFLVLNGKTELNVFNLEENKIIICQKLASSMLTTTKYLKVSKRLTATQDSFSLKNMHTEYGKLFTVNFIGLLN